MEIQPSETPSLTRRRRTFLAPIWLFGLGAVLVLLASYLYWHSQTTTTIVLVRHAEKVVGGINDAPLTPAGEQRAEKLAQLFGDAERFGQLKAIYVTNLRRTQQTAASLAQRLSLKPVVIDAQTSASSLASRVLRENRGGRALVVGHSNTVPEIVAALADVEKVPEIKDEEFDTIYIVSVPTVGKAQVLRLKY
jgi:2,3-bisphosphoglycerate-dependent phosphoglycerate mutase